ncbi:MAG: ABC transporter permease [Acidimicrobiales bacterium]
MIFRFVLRRLLLIVPLLIGIMVVTFVLMRAAPGNPWDLGGTGQGGGPTMTAPSATMIRALNERYGLDQPWWQQLGRYFEDVVRFNFGGSYQYPGQAARTVILNGWGHSLALGTIAFAFIIPVGLGLGALGAFKHDTALDYAVTSLSTLGASVPNFVFGIFGIAVLSVGLNHLTHGGFYLPDGGFGLNDHLILPVLTLSLLPVAFLTRLTRAAMMDSAQELYVHVVRTKGARERTVVIRHVLRNSLVPVVTGLGPLLVQLVTGSVVIENLFQIEGIGSTFVNAVMVRDYPVIMAGTVLYAVLFAVGNLIVDLLYMVVDPRMELR